MNVICLLSVKVKSTLLEDNTGVKAHLPILITEEGELTSLTDYLLKLDAEGASLSVINSTIRVVSLFIDYLEANISAFTNPKLLFQTFSKRLYTGTVDADGLDPSGLYWIPASTTNANNLIYRLSAFTDWLHFEQNTVQLNPFKPSTAHEQRIKYAAWYRKNYFDFLGHIEDKNVNSVINKARQIKGRPQLSIIEDDAISFPEKYWNEFFNNGVGKSTDKRSALRDKLILLLMHGGGLRKSEALLLWVTDVFEDSSNHEIANVRIYNEVEGKAPYDWSSLTGLKTREMYLKEQYGLIPRIKMRGTSHIGWKGKVVEHRDKYIQVHWFPREYGKLFMILWKDYQKYRASVDCEHPYAFISFHCSSFGKPYTINAFNQNYSTSLKRIGLSQNKNEGLDPHGHRHSYGRRLEKAKVAPLIIRKCMHHKTIESQLRYTTRSIEDVSRALNEATNYLSEPNLKNNSDDWKSLTQYGFENIDPYCLFTGNTPKLRR